MLVLYTIHYTLTINIYIDISGKQLTRNNLFIICKIHTFLLINPKNINHYLYIRKLSTASFKAYLCTKIEFVKLKLLSIALLFKYNNHNLLKLSK